MEQNNNSLAQNETPHESQNIRPARLASVDIVRGAVMILMALDHVRDYFSNAGFSPLDLSQTTPALFFTRWVTHFCAPAFILLAGTSAYLWAVLRSKSKAELARFLLTRGLWLVALELTVVRFAWSFSLDYEVSLAQVIWAIGWSMIALAGLVFLPNWLTLTFATVMIAGHNLLDQISPDYGGFFGELWTVLHRPGMIEPLPRHQLFVLYPLIPWIGVIALGYMMGPLFLKEPAERRKWLLGLGLGFTLAFVAIRALNSYGDPIRWSEQKDGIFTFLSFINVEKYPPSLLFLLVTLGPTLIALALLDRPLGFLTHPIAIFGRVPLFFYVIHLFLIHALAAGLYFVQHGQADWLFSITWLFGAQYPPDYGYGLPGIYLIWVGIVVALYPLCKWFADYKLKHQDWWLGYL
jgi:uncharacterized membrane protein